MTEFPAVRPDGILDPEWVSMGMICFTEFAQEVIKMLSVDEDFDARIHLVFVEVELDRCKRWLIADREAEGNPITEKQADKYAHELLDDFLKLRKKVAQLGID